MLDHLPIAKITVGDRHRTDHGDLAALAASIEAEGLLQPIGVTPQHELVFGERRLRACRDILNWPEIDVRVVNVSSIVAGEWHENEVRKDFTPSERVAITDAVRAEIGNRQGQRVDLPKDSEEVGLRSNCAEVKPGQRTDDAAAKSAGFGSRDEYRRAKTVVERGVPELLAKMDSGAVSISKAAEIAKLPPERQAERLQPLPSKAEPVAEPAKKNWKVPENYGDRLRASLVASGIWDRANAGELHAEPVDPLDADMAALEYSTLRRYLKSVPKHPSPAVTKAMSPARRKYLRKSAARLLEWAETMLAVLASADVTDADADRT